MNNLGIVIGREYMTRVKKKSFIILTIVMPFLMVALVATPILLGMIKDDEQKTVVILDKTHKYDAAILEAQKADSTRIEGYTFALSGNSLQQFRTGSEEAYAVVDITDDLAIHPEAVKIYSQNEVSMELQRYVKDILQTQIRKDKLSAYNIPELDNIIHDIQADFDIKTIKWGAEGEETFSSSELAMGLGMLTAMLIYMFVMAYGAMVMQSVMEEKTNRIVEVIVGSVKPFYLMMGKIIGVMLVGFTQLAIWGAMIVSIGAIATLGLIPGLSDEAATIPVEATNAQAAMEAMQAMENSPMQDIINSINNLPVAEIGILFVLYFLGGYILYASFFAAIGAAINSQEDSSQFMMPMILIMVFAMYAAMGSMDNTDGPLAFWASLFPLTSPIVMMVRIPFGVPLWQELLSVALLYATAFGFVWLGGRIYRVGILLYGKKPSFLDLIKWLRY